MNKKLIILGILFVIIAVFLKLIYVGLKNIKVDDFHKSAVIFILNSSNSNKNMIDKEIKYIKCLCSILDPEDEIKILKVSQESYLIYEGTPSDQSGIAKAVSKYTKYEKNAYGTAYGTALKKAFSHCLTMKNEGYNTSIVVIGDLENEGSSEGQINWDKLPENVKNVQQHIPELAMMFVYAHPQKLDMVKEKLTPILGEKKLIIANEENTDKSQRRFLNAIGR